MKNIFIVSRLSIDIGVVKFIKIYNNKNNKRIEGLTNYF